MAGKIISAIDEASFLRAAGLTFVDELRRESALPTAPDAIRTDWKLIAGWLGHSVGELTKSQSDRLQRAWMAYLAIGVAPSFELQPAFSNYSEQFGDVPVSDRAPTEVMNVFDRLLAREDQIRAKHAADWNVEAEKLRATLHKIKSQKQPSWWRRQQPYVRNWVFGTAVWAALIFVYAFFFDPFDVGGWERMNDDETMRFVVIELAPVGAAIVFYAYRRWVR